MGRDNSDHSAWEKQTSIGSGSSEISELRWFCATCYSPEGASLLTSWPQYQTTPYQSSCALRIAGKCRPTGWF